MRQDFVEAKTNVKKTNAEKIRFFYFYLDFYVTHDEYVFKI